MARKDTGGLLLVASRGHELVATNGWLAIEVAVQLRDTSDVLQLLSRGCRGFRGGRPLAQCLRVSWTRTVGLATELLLEHARGDPNPPGVLDAGRSKRGARAEIILDARWPLWRNREPVPSLTV